MTTIFFGAQVVLAVLITIVVLLQKSSSIGLGAYSGSNESVFGAKGPAGFLAKFTMFLGLLFVCNTIALSYFYNKESQKSVLDSHPATQSSPLDNQSEPLAPTAPSAPLSVDSESSSQANPFVVDENAAPSIPSAPLTPSTPSTQGQ